MWKGIREETVVRKRRDGECRDERWARINSVDQFGHAPFFAAEVDSFGYPIQFVTYNHYSPCKPNDIPISNYRFLHLPIQFHLLQYFILVVWFIHLHHVTSRRAGKTYHHSIDTRLEKGKHQPRLPLQRSQRVQDSRGGLSSHVTY